MKSPFHFFSHQNMTLHSAHLEDLKGNQTFPSTKSETLLLPFSEFNEVSMKNQQLSVQEMFGKHLLQLHGVSVEKAAALVDKVLLLKVIALRAVVIWYMLHCMLLLYIFLEASTYLRSSLNYYIISF